VQRVSAADTTAPDAVIPRASSGVQADVTDRDSIVAAAQRVRDDVVGADILVDNAGAMLLGPFSAELSHDYRRMIETNLLGAVATTEVFLEQLVADGRGDLINVRPTAQEL
jgi:NADP-dependent 3-hydroxy acid dehydrogenase YdfG